MTKRYALSLLTMLLLAPAWITPLWATGDYLLGAGDVVRIKVYLMPDLDVRTRVSEQGTISFPLLGEVKIGGLSERGTENLLADRLRKAKVVRQPQVMVMVEEYHSRRVSVLGQVAQPGEYVLEPGRTVVDILSKAGGVTTEGADHVVITRPGDANTKRTIELNAVLNGNPGAADISLQPDDVVFVPRAHMVFVYGAVNRAGSYRLDTDMSVVQAISVAGGVSSRGSTRGLTVMRAGADGAQQELSVGLIDHLEAGDVLKVKESLF